MLKGLKAVAASAVIAAVCVGAIAAPAQAALKHYEGTVAAVGQSSFKLKTQSGKKLEFKVNARTVFERIAGGLDGLSRGDRIQVDAKRSDGSLTARKVEPQGGHGGGNGGGHGGSDDPPGHG